MAKLQARDNSPKRPEKKNGVLPKIVGFDQKLVREIVEKSATARSFDVATNLKWEVDDSLSGRAVQLASDINPLKGAYNLARHGKWSQDTSGVWAVTTDVKKRQRLRHKFIQDDMKSFTRLVSTQGALAGRNYLKALQASAKASWANLSSKFESARQVNKQASLILNDAIDNTYRIRVAASVAFVVVGSLPAGAVAGLGVAGAAATPWWAVALAGGAYGFFAELIWNPNELQSARATGYRMSDAAVGGATGAGGQAAQHGFNQLLTHQQQRIASEASQRVAQNQLSQSVRQIQSDLAGRQLHASLAAHEGEQRLADYWKKKAQENLARRAKFVKGAGAGVFIALGLYMMKDEIKTAFNGLTAGMDRTR